MRILWLKTELLHPVDKGGKIRTYFMLKELKRHHHVTYLTLDDGTAAPNAAEAASEYCDELVRVPFATREKFSAAFYLDLVRNLASPLPYFLQKYVSPAMSAAIRDRVHRGGFDVVVCDFLVPSINLPSDIGCATLLFQHNVEALIWKRHYEVETNPLKKAFLRLQWQRSVAFERAMCHRFDKVVAVSPDDARIMSDEYSVEGVEDVPTGVDTEFFRPSGNVARKRANLVFTGSMDWLPNVDAIEFFLEEIFPLVRAEVPETTLTVVGRKPPASLVARAERDPALIVTGRVDDVRPYMEQADAYVIPIRIGGGTRLKVYEAMAMEKPIISTTVGAEGLPVRDGEELLVADEPAAFARAVVRVLRDRDAADALGWRAARIVRERFGWEGVTSKFERLCEDAIVAHRRSTAVSGRAA